MKRSGSQRKRTRTIGGPDGERGAPDQAGVRVEVTGARRELIVWGRLMQAFLASLGDVTPTLRGEEARQFGGETRTALSCRGRRGNNRAITTVPVLIVAMIILELYDKFIVRIDQSDHSQATIIINIFL